MTIRNSLFLLGTALTTLASFASETLLTENFDTLLPGDLTGQNEWADNSKTGFAQVATENSLSTPNHLELSEGGAVHREIPLPSETSARVEMRFAFQQKTSVAGRNLQISLRDSSGQSILFLNLRGAGNSLDIGPNVDALTQYFFTEELPLNEWLQVAVSWEPSDTQLRIEVSSNNESTFLSETIDLPVGNPERIIIGSTQSTPEAESWSMDDLIIQTQP
jgi:hypothetical protein